MKISIKMENNNELDTFLRVRTGVMSYANWLQQKWNKDDITYEETEDGIFVECDPKYEKEIVKIIEEAKNGAYEMM